ncbi:hypothetical protein AC791_15890 [Klebsiella sp. RIT-PI-d]|uniref:carbohydrate binding domain-containing protein n=1 Tax=Klebsiella sp. RIT-PI-d TaxID=1681196 RepID=UPI000675C078|nr:carbohydrate binding domain-containing protein [Klebsiella sp. RIT-PI-d]KNC10080.1 hypothetical protein AC791_15890 [Klebsiella sp. RIT-PI-d]
MIITKDIIIDGNFEKINTVDWILSGPTQVHYEESNQNHYCQLESTASIMQTIPLQPDTEYTLKFDCRGPGGVLVNIQNLKNYQEIFMLECNRDRTTEWHTESYVFKTPTELNSTRLYFQCLWDAQADTVDVDNIVLEETVFEYHTPEWIDWSWTSGRKVDRVYFKNRGGVVSQHNVLYIGGELMFDYGVVEAGKEYESDNNIDMPGYIDQQFVLYAVNDATGEKYVLIDKSGEDMYKPGKIYLDDI